MDAPVLNTTTDVMTALGGYLAVAELTGRKPKATSNWHKFETFPPDTYLVMTQALREHGLKAPASLWRMREPKPAEAAE